MLNTLKNMCILDLKTNITAYKANKYTHLLYLIMSLLRDLPKLNVYQKSINRSE